MKKEQSAKDASRPRKMASDGGASAGQKAPGNVGSADLAGEAALARQVLRVEAEAVARIVIDRSFHDAVDQIVAAVDGAAHGGVIVSGLGKSGLIGRKLSATLASTGTPSQFLHPVEAMHGDLGRVRRGDIVLLLSYTGNTDEVVALAGVLRQDKIPVIAIVGNPGCELARLASVTLRVGDVTEACPLNLAPTASTTAMLALGDALALAVSRRRSFGVEDFKRYHPGGGLGRQLMPVAEAMRFRAGVNLPLVRPEATVEEAFGLAEQAGPGPRRAGAFVVVDEQGKLAGIFTDGDLRRTLIRHGSDAWRKPIGLYMTRSPRTLPDTALVRDAVGMMREHRFDEIPVVGPDGRPVGLIDVQDLVALKVISDV